MTEVARRPRCRPPQAPIIPFGQTRYDALSTSKQPFFPGGQKARMPVQDDRHGQQSPGLLGIVRSRRPQLRTAQVISRDRNRCHATRPKLNTERMDSHPGCPCAAWGCEARWCPPWSPSRSQGCGCAASGGRGCARRARRRSRSTLASGAREQAHIGAFRQRLTQGSLLDGHRGVLGSELRPQPNPTQDHRDR